MPSEPRLQSSYIKFGKAGTSISRHGNLTQPFYYSFSKRSWRQLTYSDYDLDLRAAAGEQELTCSDSNASREYTQVSVDSSRLSGTTGTVTVTSSRGSFTLIRSYTVANANARVMSSPVIPLETLCTQGHRGPRVPNMPPGICTGN